MTDSVQAFDRHILFSASEYVALVARHRAADYPVQQLLGVEMDQLLRTCSRRIESERCRRLQGVAPHLRRFVGDRKPFNCAIDTAQAEAVRLCYSTPPLSVLDALSYDNLVSLADLYEGWSQDVRLDQRAMIELLGWSDGMRMLADAVGKDYEPLPLAGGAEVPLLKFIADKMRSTRQK
ncbi:hypothetical protein [Bradyrhizobium sp. 62]|uniref:hypothetical protein n=1 Tax=Bradyrhizobium sp. 62 TaxID=1043588 RepID=UPI001FFA781A|nr:hypothetical protein [Bradyrhizobium sp. 62]MCK1368295.1 hypothetical protein [Bradyrhizobium sp. 62]